MKNKVVIVIPAYNEEGSIDTVLKSVLPHVDRIILVDDGSSDQTPQKVIRRRVTLLQHIVNLGQGAALQTGFEYALDLGADIIVTYDADGQFDPKDITKIIAPILKGAVDVSLGSRFLGKVVGIPRSRLVTLKLGLLFTRLYTGLKLTDTYNGFRGFTREALAKIDITQNRWGHPAEILAQIAKHKLRLVEVPVTVYYTNYSWARTKRKSIGLANSEALKIPFQLIKRALFDQ